MTHITKQTANTIAGKDLVKTEFSNGVTFLDDNRLIVTWYGLDKVVLDQDGNKVDGNYTGLNHAQKVSEAFEFLIS